MSQERIKDKQKKKRKKKRREGTFLPSKNFFPWAHQDRNNAGQSTIS